MRQIALRGVEAKDLEAAIAFQLDGINPYGDQEVLFGWTPLGEGSVLVGIVRRETRGPLPGTLHGGRHRDRLASLSWRPRFTAQSGWRADPAARFRGAGPGRCGSGVEVYGESQARPVFSAEFDLPAGESRGHGCRRIATGARNGAAALWKACCLRRA